MVSTKLILAVIATGIALVAAQTDLPEVSEVLGNLPPELQGKVDEDQVQDIKNKTATVLREKCIKNGGPDAYDQAMAASAKLQQCVQKQVNWEEMKMEIEDARDKGKIDEVFKKYCDRSPQLKACLGDMATSSKVCLPRVEQQNFDVLYNMSLQLANFVCFKDGDRIALFYAEGGPQCVQSHMEELQGCFNSTFGTTVDTNNITIDSIPEINFGEKSCGQLTALQQCAVSALERCEQPTTANIVEALFKFVRSSTPCALHTESRTQEVTGASKKADNGAGSLSGAAGLFALMLVAHQLARD